MKLLLVGPYPPPHGGISVHVWNACSLLRCRGVQCGVLNVEPRSPRSDAYIKISGAAGLARELMRHSLDDWTFHVHINGHNSKSWLIALGGGMAARAGCGGLLTIHSGLAPQYIRQSSYGRRASIRLACVQFERTICVNEEIAEAVRGLGVPTDQIEVLPAFLPLSLPKVALPIGLEEWLSRHTPLITTAVFFRPEYGFNVLVEGLKKVIRRHPGLGCLVLGSGEQQMAAEMQIDEAGLSESVRLLGDIEHDMCLTLISRSHVFVRPTYRDGDSISVREAIALGIPVVASNVGTRPAETILFEPGDSKGLAFRIESAVEAGLRKGRPRTHTDTIDRFFNLYSF